MLDFKILSIFNFQIIMIRFLVFLLFITSSGFSQNILNNYKYIIVHEGAIYELSIHALRRRIYAQLRIIHANKSDF